MQNKSSNAVEPFGGIMRIDNNFKVNELDYMDTARYNAPLAYVDERFLISIGGITH